MYRSIVLCIGSILPFAVPAQSPVSIGKVDAEFATPFTQIGGVRELRDGRVVVLDPRDKAATLIDFATRSSRTIGRVGSGPGEYLQPQRLIALRGDSSAVYDVSNLRFMLITPDGEAGAMFQVEAVAGGMGRGSAPRAADARGRIFFEGSAFAVTAAGTLVPADSAPVLRFDRVTTTLDTLAWLHLADGNATARGMSGGGVSLRVGLRAFPARDDWAVMPDGGVAIVRARDYHVDRYSAAGARSAGRAVPVRRLPVTEADKEEIRQERRANVGLQTGRGGAVSTRARRPPADPEFPAFKPPFVSGSTFSRPNGELWVLRSRVAGEAPVYDVFNDVGSIAKRVALQAGTRLVGFGNGTVYLVRTDDDDLQYLQRYRYR